MTPGAGGATIIGPPIGPPGNGVPGGSMITGPDGTDPAGGMVNVGPNALGGVPAPGTGRVPGVEPGVSVTAPLGMTLGMSKAAAGVTSGACARTVVAAGDPSRAAGDPSWAKAPG